MMDKQLAVTLGFINLQLCINKLHFRKKWESEKAEGIDKQIEDLEQVLDVLNYLVDENKALTRKIHQIHLELLQSHKRNEDLRIYEE